LIFTLADDGLIEELDYNTLAESPFVSKSKGLKSALTTPLGGSIAEREEPVKEDTRLSPEILTSSQSAARPTYGSRLLGL
jgi:hypothetical protein